MTQGSHERCSELFPDSSFRTLLKVLGLVVQEAENNSSEKSHVPFSQRSPLVTAHRNGVHSKIRTLVVV